MNIMEKSSFQGLVQANHMAGRLSAPFEQAHKRAMRNTGMRLWDEEWAQAMELANAEERSLSSFTRRLYLRGLECYLAEQQGSQGRK
jgi:hypothetical protein